MYEDKQDFMDDMYAESVVLDQESHIHQIEVVVEPDDGIEKLVHDPLRKNHLICIPF